MSNAASAPMVAMKQIMDIIVSGDIEGLKVARQNTFKLRNNVEKLGYAGLRPFLSTYIHPQDGSEYQGMSPLHLAVLRGSPEMVEEAMYFGTDLETPSGATLDPELAQKTPRQIADVLLLRYNTPEKGSEMFKAVKSVLLRRGAKPKMKTTIMGKKLAFPDNAANVQYYKNATAMVNRMFGKPQSRKGRKTRKARKTRKTRRA
jgi:hypothetical protein